MMELNLQFLLAIFLVAHCRCEFGSPNGTVEWQTRQGKLLGMRYSVGTEYVYKFKGIPYAKPPVGELRFRKPVMAEPWTGLLNTTEYGPSCIQDLYDNDKRLIPNLAITEDCLQLNIFIPRNINKGNRLATMVWVHGGSLTNGQGTMFDGSMLALRGNVIVVTINYRLNIFGFFIASDAKGNYGIYDQQLAFKWVQENIADYGGDKSRVTIFGESAGAYSVMLHSLLPSNLGLFQRVIAESGYLLTERPFYTDEIRASSFQVARKLSCITSTNEVDLSCLRKRSSNEIFQAYSQSFEIVTAVVDGELISKDFNDKVADPNSEVNRMLQSVDMMAGINSGEAGLLYFSLQAMNITGDISTDDLCKKIIPALFRFAADNCTEIRSAICQAFTPKGSNTSLAMQTHLAADLYTDVEFLSPTDKLLKLHATFSSRGTYQYIFTHTPTWELIQARPPWLDGPNHASELTFVFGLDWYPSNITISDEERNLSNTIIEYWTNFAKTGNPNRQNASGLTNWALYTPVSRAYIDLDLSVSEGVNLRKEVNTLINDEIPQMLLKCRLDNNYTIVDTNYGRVKGEITTLKGAPVYKFKGIPYAEPPMDQRRFEKPVYHDPWTYILNAETFGPSCYQSYPSKNDESEDCLYLNIFVPRNVSRQAKRPVMVWIHGGGFTSGKITSTDGGHLAMYGDVIIVTTNYRLNVFGFFSTNTKSFKGNLGLYDQQTAIRWVKENIQGFGGDPERITLFGESAGGVSTTLQSLMPSNRGLFQRVIGESGSALARRDFQTKTYDTSRKILEILNCSSSTEKETMNCLKSKDSSIIFSAYQNAANKVSIVYSLTTTIGPIVDGELIVENPLKSIEDATSEPYAVFSSVDFLVGTNTADSGLLYFNLMGREKEFGFNNSIGVPTKVVCDHIAPAATRDIYNNCHPISKRICEMYSPLDRNASLQEQSQLAANLYGDMLEDAPTVRSLELHSKATKATTFQYVFAHRPRWEVINDRPKWLVGANHASEVVFVFGLLHEWYPSNVPVMKDEKGLSSRIMSYWTNFAKNGNPNGVSGDSWPAYDTANRKYLILDIQDSINSSLYTDRMTFWNTEIPNILAACSKVQTSNPANKATSYLCCSTFSFLMALIACILGLIL